MNRNHWARRRAKDRPSKTAKYDHDNSVAAAVILENTSKHSDFQVRWAKAFTRRRRDEERAVRERPLRTL